MSAIINIGSIHPTHPVQPVEPNKALRRGDAAAASSDTVEISNFGQALSRADQQSSLSLARIQALRREIENGTFESRARIEGTVNRLVDVLR